ncbi:MAG TPA: type II CAAX endopeptidase family protein [Rhizomicrobium sp.]|nr:type II CAAX endopeptidase family protein [Rhizomicrobium sp.]
MSTVEEAVGTSSMSAGRTALGITSFLVLAFGIAWGSWALLLPKTGGVLFQLSLLPGAFAPAIATLIVRKWITREGFADAGLGLHPKNWRYYLIGWFLPFVVLAFIAASAPMLGFAAPDFSMKTELVQLGAYKAFGAASWYAVPLAALVNAPIVSPLLFGEEFGWRGYLQLRLFGSRPTLAAVATGIIWGLWHLPIILRGYEFHGDSSTAAIAVFCVCTVLISIIFGWLRRQSGSVWATSLAHAATNAIGGSITTLWFPGAANALFLIYGGILSWMPLGLLSVWIIARRR